MELKWLEDFLSLAETRSFSRSAEARHVTQSAFSRRIQALELWLGVALIDRSTYPTTLTPAGRRFRETAEETVRMLHASRVDLRAGTGSGGPVVRVAALHTLALAFFPAWVRAVEARTGRGGELVLQRPGQADGGDGAPTGGPVSQRGSPRGRPGWRSGRASGRRRARAR